MNMPSFMSLSLDIRDRDTSGYVFCGSKARPPALQRDAGDMPGSPSAERV